MLLENCLFLLQVAALFFQVSSCLRVGGGGGLSDASGWRIVRQQQQRPLFSTLEVNNSLSEELPPPSLRPASLVEWDDDELLGIERLDETGKAFRRASATAKRREQNNAAGQQKSHQNRRATNLVSTKAQLADEWDDGAKLNRLIYHGQLGPQRNGSSVYRNSVDGIQMLVNTYKPVAISRRSFGSHATEAPPTTTTAAPTTTTTSISGNWATQIQPQDSNAASSNWRPIVVARSRNRRAGKPQLSAANSTRREPLESTVAAPKVLLDFKWKPIKLRGSAAAAADHVELFDLSKNKKSAFQSRQFSKLTGGQEKKTEFAQRKRAPSFAEPFGDDDDNSNKEEDEEREEARRRQQVDLLKRDEERNGDDSADETKTGSDKLLAKQVADKWTPLVESSTTETFAPQSSGLKTTPSPVADKLLSLGGSNSSDLAKGSASDLNYVYSSASQQSAVVPTNLQTANSYYSSYVAPAPQQQSADQQTIVDTSSGQLPEMVPDRLAPQQTESTSSGASDASSYYYSQPQAIAAGGFQPVPPPLGRQQVAPIYESYYAAQQQPTRQVLSQPPTVRQSPVVRQEHHYHYYNQQQSTSAPERSQQQPVERPQQQTVIRELQPIMISQPIVQQPSTTQAPPTQVIREIVKEVQAAPQVQIQPVYLAARSVPPPTISIPLPPPPERDSFAEQLTYGAAYAPAQRIIRQLSQSIPQVAVRMPQFRLPPIVQLQATRALANQAPVTRQTGSFVIPPLPKKTTTYLTQTQAMPTHTTIMQTTQFTPATRTTVYTTDHQPAPEADRIAPAYKS